MNESTVSSKFQSKLRLAVPGTEVNKHADKSMIGMVDASVTGNKKTIWVEYKFINHQTKGVLGSAFNQHGEWNPQTVAEASPTQFERAKALAKAGHCCYLFWVVDHKALRKRVGYVVMWHPITGTQMCFKDTDGVVDFFVEALNRSNPLEPID